MLRWEILFQRPAPFFPWNEVRAAWDSMDANLGGAPVRFAQELLGAQAHGCPGCETAAHELTWISIGTSEEAWRAGDERCGWLTVCTRCGRQVQFLVDEEITQLRREGNW